MNQEIIYSKERGTYNLIVNGEWYAEGSYEQMEQMYENNRVCELEAEMERCPEPESDYYGDDDIYADPNYDPWTNYNRWREI